MYSGSGVSTWKEGIWHRTKSNSENFGLIAKSMLMGSENTIA